MHTVEKAPKRITLAERAYQEIRTRIIDNRLAPGTPLDEEALMTELSIGRTPLREAVKRLESERLITIYSHRGTFVPEVTVRDLREISDARRLLEGYAARRAALQATEDGRRDLQSCLQELQSLDARSPADLIQVDGRIHESIYRAMGNRYIEESLVQYFSLSMRMWNHVLPRLGTMEPHVQEHLGLLQAILDGDAEEAERLAVDHVTHFEDMVVSAL
ncbi:GntR family transcriptional regulator [Citricoccus sp. SGAir0253]|uniref:GntR family transcriptional regulator n=1 Tax=Citricoccus sp. SGAir0253 TaxID=2567881 RepID=UPI0010CCC6C9|nr:GntR family transcriptional regulator [Citricoccus sp. SGAir0253]QCU78233.1 GntR family transcriptional regulator [Citricoccus sp. SGAir0253]